MARLNLEHPDSHDDAPQWYWAAWDGGSDSTTQDLAAGKRFIVASGQRELWRRARQEFRTEYCSWMPFGPVNGKATLADCFQVFIEGRERFGATYNAVVFELAKVKAFARFIKERPSDLCNWVSNPISTQPLPVERYDDEKTTALGVIIGATLGLQEGWWL